VEYNDSFVTLGEDSLKKKSTVTVILTNYNCGQLLLKAYDSVCRQTRFPDQFFIVDDFSTDDSQDIIRRFASRATFIENEVNLGIVDSLNQFLDVLNTDYAMFLASDDFLAPEAISSLVNVLDNDAELGVAYFDVVIFGSLSGVLGKKTESVKVGESRVDGSSVYHWTFPDYVDRGIEGLKKGNFITGSAMFRVEAFKEVKGFRKNYPEDHDLWIRILESGHKAIRVPKPLLYYRQHRVAQTNASLELKLELLNWKNLALKYEQYFLRSQSFWFGLSLFLPLRILSRLIRSAFHVHRPGIRSVLRGLASKYDVN
jgi:GT2 family glycosyltransferase